MQEIQRLHEAQGGKKTSNRIEWMYDSKQSDANGAGVTEEMEGYLLGKSRVDTLLKQKNDESEQARRTNAENMSAVGDAGSVRDVAAKVRDDPMLAIKKNEQATLDTMMNDPRARRRLLKEAGLEETADRGHRHRNRHDSEKHGHRRRRRHSDENEGDRSSRRHRRGHHHRKRHSSLSSRSPSPDRTRGRGRHGERRDSYRDSRRRYRSLSPSSTSSRSPPRYRENSYSRRRSRSPNRFRKYSSARTRSPRRSPSPYRRRSPTTRRYDRNDFKDRPHSSTHQSNPKDEEHKEQDRATRLAAMQSDAASMDDARKNRLQASHAQDAAERDRDDKIRTDQGRFMDGVRKQAEGIDLGESLRRRAITTGGSL